MEAARLAGIVAPRTRECRKQARVDGPGIRSAAAVRSASIFKPRPTPAAGAKTDLAGQEGEQPVAQETSAAGTARTNSLVDDTGYAIASPSATAT